MEFNYSAISRTLTVFGIYTTHIFNNVSLYEIDDLVAQSKFKEVMWRK